MSVLRAPLMSLRASGNLARSLQFRQCANQSRIASYSTPDLPVSMLQHQQQMLYRLNLAHWKSLNATQQKLYTPPRNRRGVTHFAYHMEDWSRSHPDLLFYLTFNQNYSRMFDGSYPKINLYPNTSCTYCPGLFGDAIQSVNGSSQWGTSAWQAPSSSDTFSLLSIARYQPGTPFNIACGANVGDFAAVGYTLSYGTVYAVFLLLTSSTLESEYFPITSGLDNFHALYMSVSNNLWIYGIDSTFAEKAITPTVWDFKAPNSVNNGYTLPAYTVQPIDVDSVFLWNRLVDPSQLIYLYKSSQFHPNL